MGDGDVWEGFLREVFDLGLGEFNRQVGEGEGNEMRSF